MNNKIQTCIHMVFVCGSLISVKSKYGSCSGSCTGLININNTPYIYIYIYKRKVPFVGMTGWIVNSIALAVEGSSPFLPMFLLFAIYNWAYYKYSPFYVVNLSYI